MPIKLCNLKESNEFLNLLLDNITSAVFLVDKNIRVQQFNDSFKKLFSKPESELVNKLCGNALGCSFAVDENQLCGKTSNCSGCILRESLFRAFVNNVATFKALLNRNFYIEGQKINKHFRFSSIYLTYRSEEMVLVVVDDMTEMETQRLWLVEKQRHLDEDLESAGEIQKSLLPVSFPNVESCQFSARFIPCEKVGGDIYNVFELDNDRIVIYMIDVSGHGVPAAMVTVSVSQMLSPTTGYFCDPNRLRSSCSETDLAFPKKVLEALDFNYPIERFDKYFTMSYVVLNHRESTLLSCNAGHPAPLLLRSDGQIELLEQGGSIVGMGGVVPFEEEIKTLSNGDKIIFYTDGLTEYASEIGELYGIERLTGLVTDLTKCSADEIADTIVSSLMKFGNDNPPADDIALVVLDFSSPC
ncbi:MAG: SpoIIE family protein phosphatase [Desulfomonilaceae bacterium]